MPGNSASSSIPVNKSDRDGKPGSGQVPSNRESTHTQTIAPMSAASAPGRTNGLFGWFRNSESPNAGTPAPERQRARPRRDSSTLSVDEALNISRANSTKPIPIKTSETLYEESAVASSAPGAGTSIQTQKRRNSSKYDSLGSITAFSGGPGSF